MRQGRWTRQRTWLVLASIAIASLVATLEFSPGRRVTMRWNYDYAHDPPCSSRLTGNCVSGFRVFVGELNHRSQQVFVPNRDSVRNAATQQLEAALVVKQFGYVQLCVVAVKNSQMAATVESAPTCVKRLVLPFGIGSSGK